MLKRLFYPIKPRQFSTSIPQRGVVSPLICVKCSQKKYDHCHCFENKQKHEKRVWETNLYRTNHPKDQIVPKKICEYCHNAGEPYCKCWGL
jgi:hypothetical protein